ncbi:hypothetical protein [Ochrobactrum sp. SFR4]|uniref:hypothetical protein n=1 Tax=Ochrobactrum sp. SFR4 TaxID=2717368 RepID=UPI001C8B64C5|nr:hypothetical protein [Ochrobactrum sp. SFR4]MBX8826410.1 hypothetical protein [Ochrobactrum sp. SFR4]
MQYTGHYLLFRAYLPKDNAVFKDRQKNIRALSFFPEFSLVRDANNLLSLPFCLVLENNVMGVSGGLAAFVSHLSRIVVCRQKLSAGHVFVS